MNAVLQTGFKQNIFSRIFFLQNYQYICSIFTFLLFFFNFVTFLASLALVCQVLTAPPLTPTLSGRAHRRTAKTLRTALGVVV